MSKLTESEIRVLIKKHADDLAWHGLNGNVVTAMQYEHARLGQLIGDLVKVLKHKRRK